jgi:ATP-dependent DNA helicase PIF1
VSRARNLSQLLDETFGDLSAPRSTAEQQRMFQDAVVLSPLNADVEVINAEALQQLRVPTDASVENGPLTERTYVSLDSVPEEDVASASRRGRSAAKNAQHHINKDASTRTPVEVLNTLRPAGLPPHKLHLKVGAVVILLRTLDFVGGLTNGTRGLVCVLTANVVQILLLNGRRAGERVWLPRITLTHEPDVALPMTVQRRQIPLQLAFALTINKAEGHGFRRVALCLTSSVFSHGQLYVAWSRAMDADACKAYDPEHVEADGSLFTPNVVWKELLLPPARRDGAGDAQDAPRAP